MINLNTNNKHERITKDFHLFKYGLDVRLVTESDASFILSLRTDTRLSRFIHQTDDDEDKQRQWIRDYKTREAEGKEYYFIYNYEGKPFGVNRIYNIHNDHSTGGSWICKEGTLPEQAIASLMIIRDIMFEVLNFEYECFEVSHGNKQVHKIHTQLGAEIIDSNDVESKYILFKEKYFIHRQKFIKLLKL